MHDQTWYGSAVQSCVLLVPCLLNECGKSLNECGTRWWSRHEVTWKTTAQGQAGEVLLLLSALDSAERVSGGQGQLTCGNPLTLNSRL